MTLELAQTLHGYTQGHRLLAQGGDIDVQLFGQLGHGNALAGKHSRDQIQQATETGSGIHGSFSSERQYAAGWLRRCRVRRCGERWRERSRRHADER